MKYFTKEVKIGFTAIVAIALLYLLITFLKGINIFEPSNSYYVTFKNIEGLAVSNSVYANGYPIGKVRSIQYDYDKNQDVLVRIELDHEMRIPKGTTADLRSSLMGGVTMHLLLGKNPIDCISRNDTIHGGIHQGAVEQVSKIMPYMVSLAPKLDSIMMHLNQLIGDPALIQTLRNTAAITKQLKTTTDNMNKLLATDIPVLLKHLTKTSANAEMLSDKFAKLNIEHLGNEVQQTLQNVNQFSTEMNSLTKNLNAKLNDKKSSLGKLINDDALYNNLNNTAAHADSLMQDLKQNPKRYVHFSIFGKKEKRK